MRKAETPKPQQKSGPPSWEKTKQKSCPPNQPEEIEFETPGTMIIYDVYGPW